MKIRISMILFVISFMLSCNAFAEDRPINANLWVHNPATTRTNLTYIALSEDVGKLIASGKCQCDAEAAETNAAKIEKNVIQYFARKFAEYEKLMQIQIDVSKDAIKIQLETLDFWVKLFLALITIVGGGTSVVAPIIIEKKRNRKFELYIEACDADIAKARKDYEDSESERRKLQSELSQIRNEASQRNKQVKADMEKNRGLFHFTQAQALAAQGRDDNEDVEDRTRYYSEAFLELARAISYDIKVDNTRAVIAVIKFMFSINKQLQNLAKNEKIKLSDYVNARDWHLIHDDVKRYLIARDAKIQGGTQKWIDSLELIIAQYTQKKQEECCD